MTTEWEWHAKSRRYKNTTTGRFLSTKTVLGLRDQFVDARNAVIKSTSERLANETLAGSAWYATMKKEIANLTWGEFAFGRGGMGALTTDDHEQVNRMIAAQYDYLDRFATDIADGTVSGAGIVARAQLYGRAATAAYHQGETSSWDIELPQHPGDGQTQCHTNCRCHLEIKEGSGAVEVRWIVDTFAEHCDDCVQLGREWNPLVIERAS